MLKQLACSGLACVFLLAPVAGWASDAATRTITLLFTNDFESAYEPVPAFWRSDIARIGGVAELATLIDQVREESPHSFLFDAGDIFTGTLAKLTKGAISFELMMTMGYDAMGIGNHEFEYGWQTFAQQKDRVAFPVLGANLFYKDTTHPYAQPYCIIERDGVRVGVIGVLGLDAATALVPSNIAGVDVHDPVSTVRRYVSLLEDEVDLIVVLTHQGFTAPMQTDDEADLSVQRGNAANVQLAGAVDGIDVILAGHTDAGTPEPIEHPETGTLIMQTYGQGQHLGVLRIQQETVSRRRLGFSGELIPVNSDALVPAPKVVAKLASFRHRHPEIYERVGQTQQGLVRRYTLESDVGNLFADILRSGSEAEIALMPSGALRKDLPAGDVRLVDLLDAFPFEDRLALVTVTGATLRRILEQGLSLQRGMLQVSGLEVVYDPKQPIGRRLISVSVNGERLDSGRSYRIATLEILAQGGDAYVQFKQAQKTHITERRFATMLEDYFRANKIVSLPLRDRLIVDSR